MDDFDHYTTHKFYPQRGAAHRSRVGSTPGDATRLDSSLGVAGAVQSAPHQNAGPETVSVPREIDRSKHGSVLLVWNDCMMNHESLEMTWPKLVSAMLAAGSAK